MIQLTATDDDTLQIHWMNDWWTMGKPAPICLMEPIIEMIKLLLLEHGNDPTQVFRALPEIEDSVQNLLPDRLVRIAETPQVSDAIIEYRCDGCDQNIQPAHWHGVDASAHTILLIRHIASCCGGIAETDDEQTRSRVRGTR